MQIFFQLRQIVLLLLTSLTGMLDRLLDTGNVRTDTVIAALNLVEGLVGFDQGLTLLFNLGFDGALLRTHGFQCRFLVADSGFHLLRIFIQGLPAQRLQLRANQAFFFLQDLVALGGLGLTLQVIDLFFQFVAQVIETIQIIAGMADTCLRLLAPLLVFGNAGRLFQKDTQFFRFGLDNAGDRALLDNGITARTQTRAQKDVGDVPAAATHPVQKIIGLPVTTDCALDRNFVIRGPLPTQLAVGVVEYQLDRGLSDRLARIRAVEHHIGHGVATQLLGRGLAHNPTYGIDDIGLAATIWANDTNEFTGE